MQPIQPAIAGLLGTAARSDGAPLRAQVLDLPAQLLQASAPVSLSGVVVDSSAPGQVRITTPIGDVLLRSPAELAIGRQVTIVTRPSAPAEVFLLPATPNTTLATTDAAASPAKAQSPAVPGAGIMTSSGSGSTGVTQSTPAAPTAATAAEPGRPGASSGSVAPPFGHTPLSASGSGSGPTLAPASLLATLDADALPNLVGRSAYAATAPSGPPSELLALLTDLRRLIAARDPKLAEKLLRRLPTPDRSGAVAMMALPLAARQDRLADWLGHDVTAAIESEQDLNAPVLLTRIGHALTHVEERLSQDDERTWQWRQLPLVENGHMVLFSIGVAPERERAGSGGGDGQRQERAVEFAVEVDLSALGQTRVEVAYRDRRLDLVVQCETALELDSRTRIAEAVAAVFDEFDLSGTCRFEPYAGRAADAVKV